MLYCFGDSWGYGSELDLSYEVPFINVLAQKSNVEFINHSQQGSALGKITHTIFQTTFQPDDFVVIVIPPDTRWYYENVHNGMSSLFLVSQEHLKDTGELHMKELMHHLDTISHKKIWFQYHTSLFIFSIQQYMESTSTNYLFVHNYGIINPYGVFDTLIKKDRFLDFNRSLTSLLTGVEDYDIIKSNKDAPNPTIFVGEYFEGKGGHPNQKGHIRIGELIYDSNHYQRWLKQYLSI